MVIDVINEKVANWYKIKTWDGSKILSKIMVVICTFDILEMVEE